MCVLWRFFKCQFTERKTCHKWCRGLKSRKTTFYRLCSHLTSLLNDLGFERLLDWCLGRSFHNWHPWSMVVSRLGATRLAKNHHPHHPGWCKTFSVRVKFVTVHAMYFFFINSICCWFCRKQRSFWGKVFGPEIWMMYRK